MNKKNLLFLPLFLLFISALPAQDTTDVYRLSTLEYMQSDAAKRVDCEHTDGNNFSHRICLNLAFQEIDAVMNGQFVRLLEKQESDSLRQEMILYQSAWVNHRRRHSHDAANGSRGHMLGIIYLSYMVELTRRRKDEIDYLLRIIY